ncbi:MAG TPA: hypothetical protein PLD22_02700 [Bacillota bacterium]|nr:hypothetical protein [Bacillota bacterium]
MKRIVVTNNKRVKAQYADKAEVIYLDNATGLDVLEAGKRVASEGGRLLLDPTRFKGYYKSLVFFKEAHKNAPGEKSVAVIDECIEDAKKNGSDKEPILAGIFQKKDLEIVKKILA